MLIRHHLVKFISSVTMPADGQIWLVLTFLSTLRLGGVYVPPRDSPYYEQSQWGVVAAHAVEDANTLILGDLNARVGAPQLHDDQGQPFRYVDVKDPQVNAHGREAVSLCAQNSMVVINHLRHGLKQYDTDLSFKRGGQWISELDICLAKHNMLESVIEAKTRQDILGSDHAPLCITVDL